MSPTFSILFLGGRKVIARYLFASFLLWNNLALVINIAVLASSLALFQLLADDFPFRLFPLLAETPLVQLTLVLGFATKIQYYYSS